MELKVGQIYKDRNSGAIFAITFVTKCNVSLIYNYGLTQLYCYVYDGNPFLFDKLLAEYPTWQQAVNSEEFKNGKI